MHRENKAQFVIVALFILASGFAGGYLAGRMVTNWVSAAPAPARDLTSPSDLTLAGIGARYLAQPASAEEMFDDFACPCCGQLIGECTCGMAGERRGFVTGLSAADQSRMGIYVAYADQYGLDSFVSAETRADVRGYKLASAPEERPQIAVESERIELGDVSVQAGRLQTSVTLRNDGQQDLVIDALSTSCGCTTASIVKDGQEGPEFSADAASEDWATTLAPGETAELRIYYDPAVHADARGPMTREVYVSTNDPVDPVAKVRIELNQVD